jgi:hypothetical protein
MPEIAALPELLGAGEAAGGAGEAAGGMGRMGSMLKDFNDNPVTKIAGHIGGNLVHEFMGSIGTGGGDQEKANIGPIGNLA